MVTKQILAGKQYVLSAPAACTATQTSPAGELITVAVIPDAGGQIPFVSIANEISYSHDSAVLTGPFNHALTLGGGSAGGYIESDLNVGHGAADAVAAVCTLTLGDLAAGGTLEDSNGQSVELENPHTYAVGRAAFRDAAEACTLTIGDWSKAWEAQAAAKATGYIENTGGRPDQDIGLYINGVHIIGADPYGGDFPSAWAGFINEADCGVDAEVDSENENKINLTAQVAGEAGNAITLEVGVGVEWTPYQASGPTLAGGASERTARDVYNDILADEDCPVDVTLDADELGLGFTAKECGVNDTISAVGDMFSNWSGMGGGHGDYTVAELITAIEGEFDDISPTAGETEGTIVLTADTAGAAANAIVYTATGCFGSGRVRQGSTVRGRNAVEQTDFKVYVNGEELDVESLRYTRCEKRAEFLYESWYNSLNYSYAMQELDLPGKLAPAGGGGCSSLRAGNLVGRNFDWFYSNVPTVVVHTPAHAGRHATLGVTGAVNGLSASLLESGEFSRPVGVIPFCIVDGMNDAGLVVSTNVVPHNDRQDLGDNSLVTPASDKLARISSIMLPRYVLDNFSSAREAANFIRDHVEVFHPADLISMGYEQHYLIADASETVILEFVGGRTVVLEPGTGCVDGAQAPWITNFHRYAVKLDNSLRVATPASHSQGVSPTGQSNVSPHAAGLERHNIIAQKIGSADSMFHMSGVLDNLVFTRAYQDQGANNWLSEFVGGELTVDSLPEDFDDTLAAARAAFRERDRDNPQTWQSVHSAIYDIRYLTLSLRSQEGSAAFNFALPLIGREPRRGDEQTVSITGAEGVTPGNFNVGAGDSMCIGSYWLSRALGNITKISIMERTGSGSIYGIFLQASTDPTFRSGVHTSSNYGPVLHGGELRTWTFDPPIPNTGSPLYLRYVKISDGVVALQSLLFSGYGPEQTQQGDDSYLADAQGLPCNIYGTVYRPTVPHGSVTFRRPQVRLDADIVIGNENTNYNIVLNGQSVN